MQWLVLLEVEPGSARGLDRSGLKRLLDALDDPAAGGLHSTDRYALQLEVDAGDPSEAVGTAVRRWEGALEELGLPRGRLLRVELLTRDEFEHECLVYEGQVGGPAPWPSPHADATQRGVEEALLRHAFHDPLTDLASQGLFCDQLEHALAGMDVTGQPCAVLLLDVDRFAELNERLGRRGADAVLVSMATKLQRAAGCSTRVGRLGGDQFAVILQGLSVVEASSTARRILDDTTEAVVVDGTEVRPTVSGGIALGQPGDSAEDLLYRASLALGTAQERGGARFEIFADDMANADVRRLLAEREAMTSPDTTGYLGLLERLFLAVEECRTLEDAAFLALGRLCDHAGFPLGRLYLPEDGDETAPCDARTWMAGPPERFGQFGDVPGRHPLRPGEGVAGRALASGRPVWVRDIASEPGLAMPYDAVAAGLRGALALPVVVDGRTVAVLELFANQTLETDDALLQLLTTVGAHLAMVARQARGERARTAAETRLRLLLAHSGIHIKVLGANGRLREQYPTTWPDDAALPLSAIDLVHPDDMATALRGWADALASPGLHRPFECRVTRPDGTWRWVEVTAMNMLDEPEIRGVVTYSQDIAGRKRLEDDSRKAVAQLREAEALGRLGTWQGDLATGTVEWSDGMYRVLGLEPGDVEPGFESLLALVHPDDRVGFEEHQRHLLAGAARSFVFRVVGPGGTTRWISGRASPGLDGAGRVVALHGIVQDITERKALERVVRESEQRLREVEAVAGVGSWRTDAATNATVWSPQLYDILGVGPDQVSPGLGSLMAAVHPDDRPAVEAHALLQHRLALPMDFDCRIVRPDGGLRWVRMQLSVNYDNAGVVAAYHGLVCDTTGRARDDSRVRL